MKKDGLEGGKKERYQGEKKVILSFKSNETG